MAASGNGEIPKIRVADVKFDETPIGRGGYGYVYRGEHKELGTIAIKTMIADGLLPARHLRIFKSEGIKLWELRHSSIVRLLALIMEENNYSLVLEYMHFGSLTAFRSDFPNVDWSLIVSIIRDMIQGMDYLHGSDPPILHLDLKSDNILINRRIRAKITDFGLSQWKTMTRTMTRGGEAQGRKGTVTHVPPEVWNNINTPPNKAYDVYSFGIVLWETITGDRPFSLVTDDIIPKAVMSGQRPDLTRMPASCPREVINLMTASWVQKPDKRIEFSAMVHDIDKLFEKMAPAVPEALKKLEKDIQDLYSAEDLGGDTVATADSESLFDAATKVSKPLAAASPASVEMKDTGTKEEPMIVDSPVAKVQEQEVAGPSVPKSPTAGTSMETDVSQPQPSQPSPQTQAKTLNQNQTDQKTPVPAVSSAASTAASTTATAASAASTSATATSASTASTSATATSASTTSTPPTSATSTSTTAAPSAAATQRSTEGGNASQAPAEPAYVMTEEQKKALRRVLRDPVGMLLLHKDATLCKRVFGVELDFQMKIKDSGELLKLLEQDPMLRLELQRKGPDHIGWLFNPHRMKDEIRRKRPARQPKPEHVERMKRLKEQREKRETKDLKTEDDPKDPREKDKDKKGGLSGFMDYFKRDKGRKSSDPRMEDPYMDPMMDMMRRKMGMGMGMGMGLSPDMSYKLRRALKDHRMVRYLLKEEEPPRISPVDKEVMEILQDPDRLLSIMQQDPSLMTILATTDKDAFMKIVARARGGSSRMRNSRRMMDMRGGRRMRGMYPDDLERDMMDMDLEDEMMMRMMMDGDRYNRNRRDRDLMEMLRNPDRTRDRPKPSSTATSSSSSGSSSSPTTSSPKTPTTPTSPTASKPTSSSSTSTSGAQDKGAGSKSEAPKVDSEAAKSATSTSVDSERPEIQSLPADHLKMRQEKIKAPVQRNTNTEPLQTHFGGLAKGFLKSGGASSFQSPQNSDAPNNVSTSQSASPAGSGQGGQSSQGKGKETLRLVMKDDGTVESNINKMDLPPGIQYGKNNTMVLAPRAEASSGGTQRKRSQEYKFKWKKMAKKHRPSKRHSREGITFEHVNLIAENIGPHWRKLAEEVDMRPNKIQELQMESMSDEDQDDYDCCMKVLEDLVNRKPYYTLDKLIHDLKNISCQKIAIQLIDLIE